MRRTAAVSIIWHGRHNRIVGVDGCGFPHGVVSMADDEQSAFSVVPALVQAFIGQLRAVAEGLKDPAGYGQRLASAARFRCRTRSWLRS
jgi:hypothetical protein